MMVMDVRSVAVVKVAVVSMAMMPVMMVAMVMPVMVAMGKSTAGAAEAWAMGFCGSGRNHNRTNRQNGYQKRFFECCCQHRLLSLSEIGLKDSLGLSDRP